MKCCNDLSELSGYNLYGLAKFQGNSHLVHPLEFGPSDNLYSHTFLTGVHVNNVRLPVTFPIGRIWLPFRCGDPEFQKPIRWIQFWTVFWSKINPNYSNFSNFGSGHCQAEITHLTRCSISLIDCVILPVQSVCDWGTSCEFVPKFPNRICTHLFSLFPWNCAHREKWKFTSSLLISAGI